MPFGICETGMYGPWPISQRGPWAQLAERALVAARSGI